MTDIDIPALKAVALAATPGPWEWIGRHYLETANKEIGWKHPSGGQVIECTSQSHGYLGSTEVLNVDDSDRAYIALANPATVLALIERLERAEAVAEYARSREMPTTEKQVKAVEMFFTAPMMARLEKLEAVATAARVAMKHGAYRQCTGEHGPHCDCLGTDMREALAALKAAP